MKIYNRWGEVVFETFDANIGWDGSYGIDGRDAQNGTYTYKIVFKNPKKDDRIVVKGHVNIIR
jgi:gliding motility-associated-like protein